jgi:hypothetical protein
VKPYYKVHGRRGGRMSDLTLDEATLHDLRKLVEDARNEGRDEVYVSTEDLAGVLAMSDTVKRTLGQHLLDCLEEMAGDAWRGLPTHMDDLALCERIAANLARAATREPQDNI